MGGSSADERRAPSGSSGSSSSAGSLASEAGAGAGQSGAELATMEGVEDKELAIQVFDQNRNLSDHSGGHTGAAAEGRLELAKEANESPSPVLSMATTDSSLACAGASSSDDNQQDNSTGHQGSSCGSERLWLPASLAAFELAHAERRSQPARAGEPGECPAEEDSVTICMGAHESAGPTKIAYSIRFREEQRRRAAAGGLVRRLGRRVSALPSLFARRRSKTDELDDLDDNLNHMRLLQEVARTERQADELLSCPLMMGRRRLSLQSSFPASLPAKAPASASVAGVGGTITTVSRGTRKTAPLPRLVAKNGTVNLFLDNIDRRQYVRDLFTTMIDIKWRYNLMAAAFGFVFSWLFFACIWYCVLYVHNDLAHENDPNWSPCIVNVNSFSAALLFSIETQSTLGFGSRIISVECPGAIVIFCVQLIFGVVVECLIVGMVFAKLSRPAKRSQTIMYSKYATVCLREGAMCLTFRVGDVRSKSHIIGATIRASLVSQKITEEGETIPFYHHQLEVKIDDSKNSLLLIWPVTIVHLIDPLSPFYRLNADELANFKFEIITVLEGTVESTGQSIQVRSSYLPSEVRWGYRFEPIVSTHGYGRYAQTIIDYNKFNQIVAVDTPTCSPADYYAARKRLQRPLASDDPGKGTASVSLEPADLPDPPI